MKCSFLIIRIEFLSHIIENGMLYPFPSKSVAVIHFSDHSNHKDFQAFLGRTFRVNLF